jgi:hypothetical protein
MQMEPQGQDCQQYRQRNLLFLPIAVTCKCQKDRASRKPRNTTSDINLVNSGNYILTGCHSTRAIQKNKSSKNEGFFNGLDITCTLHKLPKNGNCAYASKELKADHLVATPAFPALVALSLDVVADGGTYTLALRIISATTQCLCLLKGLEGSSLT